MNSLKRESSLQQKYRNIFDIYIDNRIIESSYPPSIFTGLSQYFVIDVLKTRLKKSIDNDGNHLPQAIKNEWNKVVDKIIRRQPSGNIILKFPFKSSGLGSLLLYQPSGGMDEDLISSHRELSELYSGAIEDVIPHDKLDIPVTQDFMINEEWILFLNYAFQEIQNFRFKNQLNKLQQLVPLPLGVEITSSIKFKGAEIKVGSMSIYYRNSDGFLYKDIAFQFNPNLLIDQSLFPPESAEDILIDFKNDGIKLLMWSILSILEKVKC